MKIDILNDFGGSRRQQQHMRKVAERIAEVLGDQLSHLESLALFNLLGQYSWCFEDGLTTSHEYHLEKEAYDGDLAIGAPEAAFIAAALSRADADPDLIAEGWRQEAKSDALTETWSRMLRTLEAHAVERI